MGKMVYTVLGAVAELERELIRERVRAGVARVRKTGEHWGRPKKIFDRQEALRLHQEGKSSRQIDTILGVGKDTILSLLRTSRRH
jgi:DNA invertase Pin-like site-specific DNA recombinase